MSYAQMDAPIETIRRNPRNARTHSKAQLRQIANSIKAFGFAAPLLVDEHRELIAGHGRLEAAKLLGLTSVPAVVIAGLSDAKRRALMLADNRIASNAGWDREQLAAEIMALPELLLADELDLSITGFPIAEIDGLHADFGEAPDPADQPAELPTGPAVSRRGDLWRLGKHRLLCGDARSSDDVERLMDGERARMAFLDPPYNLRVADVVGRGATRHREFAMASGEMSTDAFTEFLRMVLRQAAQVSLDGALHFVCMDWRHVGELIAAGRDVYSEMLNLAVWVKGNAGQGSFYRSQHELVGIFKVGDGAHLNAIELGRHGRNRSNVWHYAGVNSFRAGRMADLAAHPTVKPLAMVADAIKDCTRRGDLVLDSFCGSGTTLLAAERVGRRAHGLELDPLYVDLAVRRWQAMTGRDAVLEANGLTFDEVQEERHAEQARPAGPEVLS